MKCVSLYSLSKYMKWKLYRTMQRQNMLQWFQANVNLGVINHYTNNNYSEKKYFELFNVKL